ncbi:hypothetical protein BASA82_000507 [Batrachochytrium salamandrivorans]|nr:hypothetical protein BASA81_003508 [Batrachochytrium salamandrivorans]KAH9262439.1 hypothetical protein BASA82_000507 [Batrachochytrium salamandrivorans]
MCWCTLKPSPPGIFVANVSSRVNRSVLDRALESLRQCEKRIKLDKAQHQHQVASLREKVLELEYKVLNNECTPARIIPCPQPAAVMDVKPVDLEELSLAQIWQAVLKQANVWWLEQIGRNEGRENEWVIVLAVGLFLGKLLMGMWSWIRAMEKKDEAEQQRAWRHRQQQLHRHVFDDEYKQTGDLIRHSTVIVEELGEDDSTPFPSPQLPCLDGQGPTNSFHQPQYHTPTRRRNSDLPTTPGSGLEAALKQRALGRKEEIERRRGFEQT